MTAPLLRIAPLLFGSGFCALVYQTVWTREFRHIFGASTAASSAVLAIFIGGLGIGGVLLGRRADREPNPLRLYANLELLVSLSAALTPLLLLLAREAYLLVGGTSTLGLAGGTIARLVLSALVLAVPTLLMGGTLPAAARAAQGEGDAARRGVAILYGVNTLGAVTGAVASTFALQEVLGAQGTLLAAAGLNLLVALVARRMSEVVAPVGTDAASSPGPESPSRTPRLPLVAAGIVGFGFFLMEIVWYRMLGPLLGGTIFTFGLILAIALTGIGIGGALYGLRRADRPVTMSAFALSCLLEALFLALPLLAGDDLAVLAMVVRPLGVLGFLGSLAGWALVAALVVFPAALVAGYQFPLLIALLGRGQKDLGRQVGLCYAWNTVGAMVGALAGGFGLLPLLSAPGSWRFVVWLLAALGLFAALQGRRRGPLLAAATLSAVCVACTFATGPTAAWRHSPIGVGRVSGEVLQSPNALQAWAHDRRRAVAWEADGVESSVALSGTDGWSFIVNGKVDGNAWSDAGTQVMAGLVGAALHPAPKSSIVIGLGTGSTAGWLAVVPGMERVDVVEIEPAIFEAARRCHHVNEDVLSNPRVNAIIGDAREVLLTTRERYDLVFSEPSNPYRAGIASLFTEEFYEAVRERLTDDGLFLQWVQAYEIDAVTFGSILATVHHGFPHVEAFELGPNDLLLLASAQPIRWDAARLSARLSEAPFREAMRAAWHVEGLEGFLSHYVSAQPLIEALAAQWSDRINTDDLSHAEYGFARSIQGAVDVSLGQLVRAARRLGADRPALAGPEPDWDRVRELRLAHEIRHRLPRTWPDVLSTAARARLGAVERYLADDLPGALAAWRQQTAAPASPTERVLLAESLVAADDPEAELSITALAADAPTEAAALRGHLLMRRGDDAGAAAAFVQAFERYRDDPWAAHGLMLRTLAAVSALARRAPAQAPALFAALGVPFAASVLDEARLNARLAIASALPPEVACVEAVSAFEPHVPWRADFLRVRAACYERTGDPRAEAAKADLEVFAAQAGAPLIPAAP